MNNLQITFIASISEVGRSEYQQLIQTEYPFIQYDFMQALESSKAVGESSGWIVNHLLIRKNEKLIGFVPLYIKSHSYGEYVFDFEWAKAYHSQGLNYYPKLVTSIPFTPVYGSRICHSKDYSLEQLIPTITEAIKQHAIKTGASSWHVLFPEKFISDGLSELKLLQRSGVQFHWFNKNYESFNEFLQSLNSKRRKDILRERRKISDQKIELSVIEGKNIRSDLWSKFHQFYQLTYAKRSGHGGYLPASFFQTVGQSMADNIMLVAAKDGENMVAAALFFKDSETLYGRYWGCNREYDFLHFETCYYQGIIYCIEQKLQRFDAGAQGEHKIQRGFEAVKTWSNHWIEDQGFNRAINHYLKQEKQYTNNYLTAVAEKSPYKKN